MQLLFGNRYYEVIDEKSHNIFLKKQLNKYNIYVNNLAINQVSENNEVEFIKKHRYLASYGFTNKRFILYLTRSDEKNTAYLFNLNSDIIFQITFSADDDLFKENVFYGEILTTKQTNIFFIEDLLVCNGKSTYNEYYNHRYGKIEELMKMYNYDEIFNDLHLIKKEFMSYDDILSNYEYYLSKITKIAQDNKVGLRNNIIRFIPNKLFNTNYDMKFMLINNRRFIQNTDELKLDKTEMYVFEVKANDEQKYSYDLYYNDKFVGKALVKTMELNEFLEKNDNLSMMCKYDASFDKWQPLICSQ